MIEHMFGTETAFRHFKCRGVIHRRRHRDKIIFKCATCWEWSEDLLDLAVDPRLKTAESPKESQPAAPTPATD